MSLLYFIIFFSGILSSVSPGIIPLLPMILPKETHLKGRPYGIFFGVILSFIICTYITLIGATSLGLSPDSLQTLSMILIAFCGIIMMNSWLFAKVSMFSSCIAQVAAFLQEKISQKGNGFINGLFVGFILGLIWTPFASPLMAAVIALIDPSLFTFHALFIVLLCATGVALPLFFYARDLIRFIPSATHFAKSKTLLLKVCGLLVFAGAVFSLYTGRNGPIEKYLLHLRDTRSATVANQSQSFLLTPKLPGITSWINTKPLTTNDLSNKIVVLYFWNFSSPSSPQAIIELQKLYNDYNDKGTEVIGVYDPEFSIDTNQKSIEQKIQSQGITFPVALDLNHTTRDFFHVKGIPSIYILDKSGQIILISSGISDTNQVQKTLHTLLGLGDRPYQKSSSVIKQYYLGYNQAENYDPQMKIQKDIKTSYSPTNDPEINKILLRGPWIVGPEFIEATDNECELDINCVGKSVQILTSSTSSLPITLRLDSTPIDKKYYTPDINELGALSVKKLRVYSLYNDLKDAKYHILSLQVPEGTKIWTISVTE